MPNNWLLPTYREHWFDVDNRECLVEQIKEFVSKMGQKGQSSSFYKESRNARSPLDDIAIGKYGEFAANQFLCCYAGFPAVEIDMEVRTGRSKGWACDLPFAEVDPRYPNCHVKTCDSETSRFVRSFVGSYYSWTFQCGKGGTDPLFGEMESNDLVAFIYVPYFGSKKACFVASSPWNKVNGILREPISKKYIGIKKCVYSNDMKNLVDGTTDHQLL